MPSDDGKVWICKATRACGFKTNYPSRTSCWGCGRDREGRQQEEPSSQPRRRSRKPSRSRKDEDRDDRPPHPRDTSQQQGGAAPASASSDVAKCRRALAQLRRLYADDESNAMVGHARQELAKAEAEARAGMAPDELLRSAKGRLAVKQNDMEQQESLVKDLESKLADAAKKFQSIATEVSAIKAEVAQAQTAVAMEASLAQPVTAAAMANANAAAMAMEQLQHILSQAQLAVQGGNSKETVGAQLLDSLASQLGQARQQQGAQQPAPAHAPAQVAPAPAAAPLQPGHSFRPGMDVDSAASAWEYEGSR